MANIVITGSTKGIGKGLAQEFVKQGHSVAISGRSQDTVDKVIAELESETVGGNSVQVIGLACDTTNKEQVQALWDLAKKSFDSVDIWINNAGLARTVWPILDTPDEEITKMVTTNILGSINGCKVAAVGMKSQRLTDESKGKIFNMLGGGSDGEYFAGMGVYGTTKRALDYFTNALSKELKNDQVIIGKIRPGMIITEGVIREAKADLENFQRRRKMANALCDTVETVSPYLVKEILAFNQTGKKIRWLNPLKMTMRMLKSVFSKTEDKFSQFGL